MKAAPMGINNRVKVLVLICSACVGVYSTTNSLAIDSTTLVPQTLPSNATPIPTSYNQMRYCCTSNVAYAAGNSFAAPYALATHDVNAHISDPFSYSCPPGFFAIGIYANPVPTHYNGTGGTPPAAWNPPQYEIYCAAIQTECGWVAPTVATNGYIPSNPWGSAAHFSGGNPMFYEQNLTGLLFGGAYAAYGAPTTPFRGWEVNAPLSVGGPSSVYQGPVSWCSQ